MFGLNISKFFFYKRKPKSIVKVKKLQNQSFNYELNYKLHKFGNKNSNKTFYVIRRNPGAGMFSNINFVIHHLFIAEKFNFIPVVDMENFPNYYNEKYKIYGTKNSWEYYFYPINNYKLRDVYLSKRVIICGKGTNNNPYITGYKKLPYNEAKYFKKYLKFKPHIVNHVERYTNNVFKNKKILGVHFRGSDQKTATNHPYPPSINQIVFNVDQLIKKHKYDLIFLVTEENHYYDYLKKRYNEKLCSLDCFRSYDDIFKVYPRKNHRYKLGLEAIINTLLLSKVNHLIGNDSNMISSAISLSKKKLLFTKIDNSRNSKNIFLAAFLWKLKSLLPKYLGGFDIKLFSTKTIFKKN